MHRLLIFFFAIITYFSNVVAHYNGPFVIWGLDKLQNVQISALDTIENQQLRSFYTKANSIKIFLKNETTKLNEKNFPTFKELIDQNEFIYLTQDILTSDPIDYNTDVEVRKKQFRLLQTFCRNF